MSTGKKLRLYAGTINARPDDDEWRNFTLDVERRVVWDRDLSMGVWPHFTMDITNLVDFRAAMWDEIVLHHVLEHLPRDGGNRALDELRRVLKDDGVLDIEVPDMQAIVEAWATREHEPEDLMQWIYGEQLPYHAPGDSHRYGWTEDELHLALRRAGFDPGDRVAEGLAMRFRAVAR